MGYESEPLTSYLWLRNWSHSSKLIYGYSLSTPKVHLACPGPTISPSDLSPESIPPWHIVHRWGCRPPFLIWPHAASWCTFQWGEVPRHPLPSPPVGIPTPCPPHVLPSSLWSAFPPGGRILPKHLASPLSPPISHFRTGAPTLPPPYTLPPGS